MWLIGDRRRVSDNNNISQLLRDSFSVSQQPPIWEPPSHYSMEWIVVTEQNGRAFCEWVIRRNRSISNYYYWPHDLGWEGVKLIMISDSEPELRVAGFQKQQSTVPTLECCRKLLHNCNKNYSSELEDVSKFATYLLDTWFPFCQNVNIFNCRCELSTS